METRRISLLLLLVRGMLALAAKKTGPPYFTQQRRMKGSFIAWPAWHSIKLKCKADGPPPLRFQWLKDGKPLLHRRLQPGLKSNLWYLRIRDIVPSDTGDYTCVVSNPYGQVNHTYTLHVVAKSRTKPLLKCGYPKNTTSQIGRNVTLTCIVAVSGSLPDFRWIRWNKVPTNYQTELDFKQGNFTVIDPIHYKTIAVGNLGEHGVDLRLKNVTEEDFGLYTCVCSNHLGQNYRSAFLSRRKDKLKRTPTNGAVIISRPKKPTTHGSGRGNETVGTIAIKLSRRKSKATEPRIPLSAFIGALTAWASMTVAALLWCHFRSKKNKQEKQESSWL